MAVAPRERATVTLRVNGVPHEVEVEARWLLSDVLRHSLGLTGTHVGCEHGVCGCCTVLVDGAPARSCLMFAATADGAEIRTVEGLAAPGTLNALQDAFVKYGGAQCGICTPGMLLAATSLLEHNPQPDEAAIRQALAGNLCRCTGYMKIFEAVLHAAQAERAQGGRP